MTRIIGGDVYQIEIERVSNGWQAKVWRDTKPNLIKLVAATYGEMSDLVFSHVAEQEASHKPQDAQDG